MNREQASFLLGGVLFGLVAGLVLGMIFFKEGVLGAPEPRAAVASSASSGTAPAIEPSTGGMDPGGMAAMEQVTRELDALKAAVVEDPGNVDALMRLGDLYFEVSMFDRSREYYERAVEADPTNPMALSAAGLTYYRMAEPARAIDLYRQALRNDEGYWPAHAYLVMAAMETGDTSLAERSLAELRRLNPGFEHLQQFEAGVGGMGSHDLSDAAPPAGAGS